MNSTSLATAPPRLSSRIVRIWLRPTGLSWKIRTDDECAASELRNLLEAENCPCTEVSETQNGTHAFFFARPPEDRSRDFIQTFVRAQPGLRLMHDPA